MSVYKIVELVGTSPTSWEEAAKEVIETSTKSLRDLRVAEVDKLDMKIENGKIVEYRARVKLSFKFEGSD
ncbi:MAG: dodecin family protein [Syntrophobacteraceae bacterium]